MRVRAIGMRIFRNRLSVAVALCAALNSVAAPAFAASGNTPYFRMRYGEDASSYGMQVAGGPAGMYYTRQSNAFGPTPAPSASMAPVTWSATGPLPDGILLDAATGVLAGAASATGTYGPFSLVATDASQGASPSSNPLSATGPAFTIKVLGPASVSYAPPALVPGDGSFRLYPDAPNIVSGKYQLNQTLPSTIAFDAATGIFSVLPGANGTYSNLIVTVTDFDKATASSQPFTLNVTSSRTSSFPVNNTQQTLVQGKPYSYALNPTGLATPISYGTAAGSLPPGLYYCTNPGPDRICGTPTTLGTYPGIVISAVEPSPPAGSGLGAVTSPITMTVVQPSLTYANANPSVGKTFTLSPSSTYLDAKSYAFKGAAPAGVTVDPSTGVVSGTLSSTQAVQATVTATTSYGTSVDSNSFTLQGKLDAFSVSASPGFVQAHVGYGVLQQFTASTTAAVSWAVTSGTLPPGLQLDGPSGLLGGVGTAPANVSNVVVTATAGGLTSSSDQLRYQILPLPTVTAASAYTTTVGQAVSLAFAASNIIGSPSFTADPAKLPPGLSLNGDGTLTGTPTQAGTYDGIVVSVTDPSDGSGAQTQPFTIAVVPGDGSMMAAGMPSAFSVRVNNPLTTQAPTVSGTSLPVVWSLAPDSAPLPAGMQLDPNTGVISGTPTQTGDTAGIILVATEVVQKAGLDLPGRRVRLASNDPSFVVAAAGTQPTARSARTRAFTISVAPPLQVTNVQPAYALKVASPVSVAPRASGVLGSTSWTLSGGTLPNAVAFDPSTGRIAGPAMTPGRIPVGSTNQLVVTATDSFDGAKAQSSPFVFTIDPGLVVVGPTSIGTKTNVAYSSGKQFTATNAQGSLTWSVVGTLPAGFSVDPSTGVISGQSGHASVTNGLRMQALQADNTAGVSAPFNFIVQGGIQISYPALVQAHINQAMPPVSPTVTGAQGTVSYGVASGVLPPGIRVDSGSGQIIGTPTVAGNYAGIQIGASDTTGNNGVSQAISVVVDSGMSWRVLAGGFNGRNGTPFTSTAPAVYGAIGNVHYRLVGSLWDWKVDSSTGVITGSPQGNYYGTYISPDWLIAYDDAGAAISHPAIVAKSQPQVEMDCTYGGSSVCWFNATGGVPTNVGAGYIFYLVGQPTYTKEGTWPDWLSLDPLTGIAYGTPPAGAAQYVFTTRLTDGFDGSTTTRDRGINVDGNAANPNFSSILSVCVLSGGTVDTGAGHLSGTDPSAPVTLSIDTPLPSWLTFDPSNGRITGTVPSGPSAYYGSRFSEYTLDPKGNQVWMDGGNHYINTYPYPASYSFPAQASIGYQAGTWYDSGDPNQRFVLALGDSPSLYVSGGTMPPGLSLASSYWRDTWWIAGRPTAAGTYTFSVTAQGNSCNNQTSTVTREITVTVNPNPNAYVDAPMAMYARVGVPYRGPKPVVVNPPAPNLKWQWAVAWGLPPGLSIDQGDGSVYGTPTQTYSAGQKYDASNCCQFGYIQPSALDWGMFYVLPGPAIAMQDQSLPAGTPASVSPNATGFLGQVVWSGANMPPGLGVDPGTGLIVGTPTTPGTYPNVTVKGTETTLASTGPNDPNALYPSATSNAFTITVTPGVAVGNVADQTRILGQPFDVRPTASGITGSATWYATGTLPDGVSIDPTTGIISGPGNRYGKYPIQVGVAGGGGVSALSQTFTLTVTDSKGAIPTGTSNWTWGAQVCTYSCAPATVTTVTTPVTTTTPGSTTTTPGSTTTTPDTTTTTPGSCTTVMTTITQYCVAMVGQRCGRVDPVTGAVGPMTQTNGQPMGYSTKQIPTTQCTPATTTTTPGTTTTTPGTTTTTPDTTTTTNVTSTVITPGACMGRQLQTCSGDGCEAPVRGCDAPYSGGDTSYPIGTTASSCANPSISPAESYCPQPPGSTAGTGSGGTGTGTGDTGTGTGGTGSGTPATTPAKTPNGWWAYNPNGGAGYNGFMVRYYKLACFDSLGGIGGPNCSATLPTPITDCMVNSYGIGNCGSGVPFAEGGWQQSYNPNVAVIISNKPPGG